MPPQQQTQVMTNTISNMDNINGMPIIAYRNDLMTRFGGPSNFEMILGEYCDGIQNDAELKHLYGQMDSSGLIMLQKELLDLAFMEGDQEFAQSKVVLKHYRLFELGLNASHFERLKVHLTEALRSTWVDESVVEEAIDLFSETKFLFLSSKEDSCGDVDIEIALNDCDDNSGEQPRRQQVRRLSRELKQTVESSFSDEELLEMVGKMQDFDIQLNDEELNGGGKPKAKKNKGQKVRRLSRELGKNIVRTLSGEGLMAMAGRSRGDKKE